MIVVMVVTTAMRIITLVIVVMMMLVAMTMGVMAFTMFVMAIVVEALIEYAKTIGKAFADGSWKVAVTQLAAITLGVLLCFMTGGDLFAVVGITFAWSWLGVFLTGILISRGANYVSDFAKRLHSVKGE